MQLYINILGKQIPSYGLLITVGALIGSLIAVLIVKKEKQDVNDFIILEMYGICGGFLGAKLLYFIVSFKEIDWGRMLDPKYFSQMMSGGFVFYGGAILGILFVMMAGKIHKIDYISYMKNVIFLLPFAHAFGRLGCHMAGCCHGIAYDGWGSIQFPEGSIAPSAYRVFPVQLVEAIFLFVIALILFYARFVKKSEHAVELYLILYGILRFALENLRADAARGFFLFLSTSQWISILMIVVAIVVWIKREKRVA